MVSPAFVNLTHRGQEIRHSHPGVQHTNKISRGDALPLGDPQHFGDGAFNKLSVGLFGLSDIIHCPLSYALLSRTKKAGCVRRSGSEHFRSSQNDLRIADHPAVQIVRTKFADYLDFPHSAEMLGHRSGQNCTL
jgi:hypothetical protein